MRYKKAEFIVLVLLYIGLVKLQAQEAISATGGNASGSDGSVSYSIGQVFISANSGSNGIVAQGVQQPYEISVISRLEDISGINLCCSAYPNPTNSFLTLLVESKNNIDISNLTYILYDISGNILDVKKIIGDETILSMENLFPSTYFLKITDNSKEIKIFKIIKN